MRYGILKNDWLEKGRIVLFLSLALTMNIAALAQSHDRDSVKKCEVFSDHEQLPQFPGGRIALAKFLQTNVIYPPEAIKDSIQGRVVVQFIVDSLGYVGDVKVVRSVDERLDREAVRVCGLLPRFSPGRLNGRTVNMNYTLPVTFTLQYNDAQDDHNQLAQ